jgi:hypothetical protein
VTFTYVIIQNFSISLLKPKLKELTMRKLVQLKAVSLFVMAFLVSTVAFGQKKPLASPRDSVKGTVAGSTISINYGSPAVKGRTIGGEIAPYGKIWRTGANEATIFTTSKDINIGGKTLKAGKYSLYTVPGEKEWKIIFNSQTGQWGIKMDGSTTDDASKDVLTTTVNSMKSQGTNERMIFKITKKGFVLLWGDIAVPVMVK